MESTTSVCKNNKMVTCSNPNGCSGCGWDEGPTSPGDQEALGLFCFHSSVSFLWRNPANPIP